MNLGADKTAVFNVQDFRSPNSEKSNNMVLKTKDYFENTVKKIGFWDSESYFYENKKQQKPAKNPNNSPVKTENKGD